MGMFDKLFGKKKREGLTKSCPYCGQVLGNAYFKCTRCNKWVDNEVFHRLCDDDVKLIKNEDLVPVTPTLIAAMLVPVLKECNLLEELPTRLGIKNFTEEQQFNLLVFWSFCHFMAISTHTKMKRGHRDTITKELEVALLQLDAQVFTNRIKHATSLEALIQRGTVLYRKLEAAWDKCLREVSSPPEEVADAFAAAVFADNHPGLLLLGGLELFLCFTKILERTRDDWSKMFLVEESDFDWQSLSQPGGAKAR